MEAPKKQRLLLIDGMRGIAAMMVVFFHFRVAVNESSSEWIWPIVDIILSYGYLGVDIFFVISGFVISYSVRNAEHTPSFLLRFGVRRSIRLDPPYWSTIILELLLIKFGLIFFSDLDTPFPDTAKILVHFVYMQNFLGYGDIIPIFWTLCYEVQFYLFFVGIFVLARLIAINIGKKHARIFLISTCTISFLWSVLITFGPMETPIQGFFIDRLYQFLLGVFAMHCYRAGRVTPGFALAFLTIILVGLFYTRSSTPNGITAVVASCLLVVAARHDAMSDWLAGTVLQFLGKISYSLYLIHLVIGWRFIKLLHRIHGIDFTPIQAWLAYGAGICVSIISAWLMYKLLEAPSLNICHKIRLDQPLTIASLRRSVFALRDK